MNITAKKTFKLKWIKVILIYFLLLSVYPIIGQDANKSESSLIKNAEHLFELNEYQQALPLFAQLVSVHPNEPVFNFKFGVCTLFGDRDDKSRPIRYLKNAEKGLKNKHELNHYLGLAYYQNGEFVKAMQYLNLYLAKLAPNSSERPEILEKVNACLNGITLNSKEMVAEVLNSSEFQKTNFHRAYRADEFKGMLILKPESLNSSKDKKKAELSFVYVSEPREILYFTSYSQDGSNKDIYKASMQEDGNWSDPEKLDETINSLFDEDYPVLMDNGTTLYFCSKGHNSIGGYDVFRSKLDTTNNVFTEPENLGIGVNSPFDDILFIIDKTGQFAYFTSDRDNLNGSVNVYKVRLNGDPYGGEQILAQTQSLENLAQTNSQPNANITQKQEIQTTTVNQTVQPKTEVATSDPALRAAKLKNDLARNKRMTDSAFLFVSQTKELVRDITNQRDRANSITQKNEDLARMTEIEFEDLMSSFATITDDAIFEQELLQAMKLKKDIIKYRTLADHSSIIARNLGKNLKLKNTELEYLKGRAGKIQSLAVSGTADEAQPIFAELITHYNAADTVSDYSENIIAIIRGNIKVEIPETELAFANKLKEQYNTETVIAATSTSKPEFDETVPIIVVDKRNNSQQVDPTMIEASAETQFEAINLISPILSENLTFNGTNPDEEDVEINFLVDQIEAIKLINEFNSSQFALAQHLPAEEDIEINMDFDKEPLIIPEIVDQISTSELLVAQNLMDEESLQINFTSDHIKALELVEAVNYSEMEIASAIPEDDIEINFTMDQIEALKLAKEVTYDELAIASILPDEDIEVNLEMDKENLIIPNLTEEISTGNLMLAQNVEDEEEINITYTSDQVEALKIAEEVKYSDRAMATFIPDEDIEVSISPDKANLIVPELIEEISTANLMLAHNIADEEVIDINFISDQVEALKIAEELKYSDIAMATFISDEDIEVSISPDIANLIVPELIEEISTANLMLVHNIADEEVIDINFTSDQVEALKIAEEVKYSEIAMAAYISEEDIEVNIESEKDNLIVPELTEEISTGNLMLAQNIADEEELDINFSSDQVKALKLAEEVIHSDIAMASFIPDEDIEVNIESEKANLNIPELTDQISSDHLLVAENLSDEKIEIDFDQDQLSPIQQVDQIETRELTFAGITMVESIEINVESNITEPGAIAQQIIYNELYLTAAIGEDEILEINLTEDLIEAVENLPQSEILRSTELAVQTSYVESEKRSNYTSTNETPEETEIDLSNEEKSLLADNSMDLSAIDSNQEMKESVSDMIAQENSNLYYLRESITYPSVIETNKNDWEILDLALIDSSDELTYEELLYAASLASDPHDKLAIYNTAFIHIDRDWRAFNNAAVTSLHVRDFDKAECYLNQASMIAERNGKIQNNYGVLACYKRNFNKARQHFLVANEWGSNSQYNLEVVNTIVANNTNTGNTLNAEVDSIEILGDIMDYSPDGND